MLQTDIDIFKNLQQRAEQSLNIGDEIIAYNKSQKIKGIKGKVIRKSANTISVSLINRETLIPLTTYYKWSRFWRFEPVSMEHGGKTKEPESTPASDAPIIVAGIFTGPSHEQGGISCNQGTYELEGEEAFIDEDFAFLKTKKREYTGTPAQIFDQILDEQGIAKRKITEATCNLPAGYAICKRAMQSDCELNMLPDETVQAPNHYRDLMGAINREFGCADFGKYGFQVMKKGGKICPIGTKIQTLLFSKNQFTKTQAEKWAAKNDFVYNFVDEKEHTYRIRQKDPSYFKENSFRTIELTDGLKAVIGCPNFEHNIKAEGGGIGNSILTQETDLKGGEKETWMEIIPKKINNDDIIIINKKDMRGSWKELKVKRTGRQWVISEYPDGTFGVPDKNIKDAKSINELKDKIVEAYNKGFLKPRTTHEHSLSENKYQQAISEGRMTANDAKTIIESAGLEVPKDILDMAEKEKGQIPSKEIPPKATEPILTPTTPAHFTTPANQPSREELRARLQHLIEDAEPRKCFLVETNRLTELCGLNECLDLAQTILNSGKSDEDILHYCNTLNKHISGTQYGGGGEIGSKAISYRLQILSHILQDHPITLPQNEREFVADLIVALLEEEKISKREVDKFAKNNGITNFHQAQELTELAIVKMARSIAAKQESTEYKYNKIVELYQKQPNLAHRTSTTFLKQQYSTPAPIAYLAGHFCHVDNEEIKTSQDIQKKIKELQYEHDQLLNRQGYYSKGVGKLAGRIQKLKDISDAKKTEASTYKRTYFEPSAGNGLLTIASKPENFIVNELDDTRRKHLWTQGYKAVWNRDASEPFTGYKEHFDAVITNPPFGSIEPVQYDGFEITGLEHLMALRALDTLKDTGRAAIIIGGHTKYDERGRIQAGRNRNFFMYLYKHYNVQDVINISGNLYSRMGTSFDIRLILISGRKAKPEGLPPLNNTNLTVLQPFSSQIVETWDILFKRIYENIK